jgi:hypothetical protein
MKLTLPNLGLGSPLGLPKLQSSIARVKTLHPGVFFISLEIYWIVDVKNGLAWAIWTSATQVMAKRRAESRPLKVGNRPDSDAWRWSATHCWKALEESYKFTSDLIPIEGLSKKLWSLKVLGVQIGTISRLLLGSPGTKTIRMWVPQRGTKYTIWGKVVASFEFEQWWVKWIQSCPWLVIAPRVLQNLN